MDQTIQFGAGPSAQDVLSIQIPLTDDDIALEAIERYDVNLEIVGSPTNIVIGRHEMTTVNVLDNDGKFLCTVRPGSTLEGFFLSLLRLQKVQGASYQLQT